MVDIIFSICEVLILTSYLSTNILTLRILTIIGMLCYVAGAFIAGQDLPGMKTIILFSSINILVNVYQSILVIKERIPIFLPENVQEIYTKYFKMMTIDEFNKIYKLSFIKKYTTQEVLCVQNEPINHLIIVVQGSASVWKNNVMVATLTPGDFIGEMSFIWGGQATASVTITSENTECIVWEKAELTKQLNDQPQLYLKFKQAIAVNLVKKLNNVTPEGLQPIIK